MKPVTVFGVSITNTGLTFRGIQVIETLEQTYGANEPREISTSSCNQYRTELRTLASPYSTLSRSNQRSALRWAARRLLYRLLNHLEVARQHSDLPRVERCAALIQRVYEYLSQLPYSTGAIGRAGAHRRWRTSGSARRSSGRMQLQGLSADWLDTLWDAADEQMRDHIAVLTTAIARFATIERGIVLTTGATGLCVTMPGSKQTAGERISATFDPQAGKMLRWMEQRVRAAGGRLRLACNWRKFYVDFKALVQRVLGKSISPNAIRHQSIADAKAAGLPRDVIAMLSGQKTTRAACCYGVANQGRSDGFGLLDVRVTFDVRDTRPYTSGLSDRSRNDPHRPSPARAIAVSNRYTSIDRPSCGHRETF